MSSDDTTLAFITETQIRIFDDARHELQLSIPAIAKQAKLPTTTVNAWAQGRNTLSLWGLKKLLRVKELAPLLSRLFEPEEFALVAIMAGVDHDEISEKIQDYLREKERAHHPESPAGRDLAPCEESKLCGKFAVIAGGRAA